MVKITINVWQILNQETVEIVAKTEPAGRKHIFLIKK